LLNNFVAILAKNQGRIQSFVQGG